MIGAIGVHATAWLWLKRRDGPWVGETYSLPQARQIDPRLLGGAVLFGLGWGLGGFCPGPALVSLTGLTMEVAVFVISMLGGMMIYHGLDRPPPPSS